MRGRASSMRKGGVMEQNYNFGGVGINLRAPDTLLESPVLVPFAAPEPVPGWTVEVTFVSELPHPAGAPCWADQWEAHWKQPGEEWCIRSGQTEGMPRPYCAWVRRNDQVRMYWVEELQGKLSVWQTLDALDLLHLLLERGGVVLHAAWVLHNGTGILFSGPSGVGKSTQAALWAKYRGAEVINGDRCLLRLGEDGRAWAHGICYSGTSGICQNRSAPVAALVLVTQGAENRVAPLGGLAAFKALLPQCAYRTWDAVDVVNATDILSRLLTRTPTFRLECRVDAGAVECLERVL